MRVLVIGSGAREHALIGRLSAERDVAEMICAPGNPGISRLARTVASRSHRPRRARSLAEREQIDFTIVGPELPLSLGIADRFIDAGRLLFGPTAAAARLESSKAFAKDFMARHGVPTARFRVCESLDAALASVRGDEFGLPVVLKADGLAAGKGVVIAEDRAAADAAIARRDDRRPLRRGRRSDCHRRMSGRAGSVVLRDLRRRARRPDWHGSGSQAHLRRRSRAEHRRHGRVRAEPIGGRRPRSEDHARDRRARGRRYGGRRPSVPRFSVRRVDVDA